MSLVGSLLAVVVAIILLALAADLAVSNPGLVTVNLWILDSGLSMPTWLLAVGSFAAGLIVGGFTMLIPLTKSAWQKRQLRSRIRKLEKAAPVADDHMPRLPGHDE